jgi:predicted lipoprotein with Yx(FWY)xxD motif
MTSSYTYPTPEVTVSRYRIRILTLCIAVASLTASLVAVDRGAAATTHHPSGTKVQLRNTDHGKILVTSSGDTLYLFTHDTRNKDTCVKISGCTGTWPVLKTKAKPIAGTGVNSHLLGTITLAHGVKQVTYATHPLYTYKFSGGPGDTSYIGTPEFGGDWDAINAKGHTVR